MKKREGYVIALRTFGTKVHARVFTVRWGQQSSMTASGPARLSRKAGKNIESDQDTIQKIHLKYSKIHSKNTS